MPPEVFGDPTRAKYIVVVSHAWLSPQHADPDGMHLDIVLSKLKKNFGELDRSTFRKRIYASWWRYYYLEGEGDILFFFDMSSLTQVPRSPREQEHFKHALVFMNFLYSSFRVLVVDEIPESCQIHGYHVPYMDKGWCWAEVQIAGLSGRLEEFSPGIINQVARQRTELDSFGISIGNALHGHPSVPDDYLQSGRESELMTFRESQTIQGKVFTNGKNDLSRVSRILHKMERIQTFRSCLQTCDVEGVAEVLENPYGLGRTALANIKFDDDFTTPLHLAIEAGSIELVSLLCEAGAKPCRDFHGRMPWEWYALMPRFGGAAMTARSLCSGHRLGAPVANHHSRATIATATNDAVAPVFWEEVTD